MSDPAKAGGAANHAPRFAPQPAVQRPAPAPAPAATPAVVQKPQLPQGPGFLTSFPGLDLKSLNLVSFDSALGSMDLRDKKNQTVRLKQNKDPAQRFTLELVVARETRPLPLTLAMGRELAPLLRAATARAALDPNLSKLRGPSDFAELFAQAAGVPKPASGAATLPAANKAAAITVALQGNGFSGPQKTWGGFTAQPAPRTGNVLHAPAPAATPATEQVAKVAPGLDVATSRVGSANGKGTLELQDAAGNLLILQQTRFAPPPQATVEFAPRSGSGGRQPINAALARELSALVAGSLARTVDKNEALERASTAFSAMLLKIV